MELFLSCTNDEWGKGGTVKHETDGTRVHFCLHVQMGKSSVLIFRNSTQQRETPLCNTGFCLIIEGKYKKQNCQQVGRDETPTKHK